MNGAKIIQIKNLADHWEEYFENPIQEYFNLEKKEIRLLTGNKKGAFIRKVPVNYGEPSTIGFALLRGYNCQARCIYCYLQSYFKSPDIINFLNINDYLIFLEKFLLKFYEKYSIQQKIIFYDGDFQDSLGFVNLFENINQLNQIITLLEKFPNSFIEIRTKNVLTHQNFSPYEKLIISSQVQYGLSFSPQVIITEYEGGTANLADRIAFAKYIISRGGKIAIKIDPIIIDDIDNLGIYQDLIYLLNSQIPENKIINRTIGLLRIKENLYKYLVKKKNKIINGLVLVDGFRSYPVDVRKNIYQQLQQLIKGKLIICMDNLFGFSNK